MVKASEAQKRATRKYQKENVLNVAVCFNRRTEPELFEFIRDYEGSRPAILRESLREHIERQA